jgi:hypothetical protein
MMLRGDFRQFLRGTVDALSRGARARVEIVVKPHRDNQKAAQLRVA